MLAKKCEEKPNENRLQIDKADKKSGRDETRDRNDHADGRGAREQNRSWRPLTEIAQNLSPTFRGQRQKCDNEVRRETSQQFENVVQRRFMKGLYTGVLHHTLRQKGT